MHLHTGISECKRIQCIYTQTLMIRMVLHFTADRHAEVESNDCASHGIKLESRNRDDDKQSDAECTKPKHTRQLFY